MKKLKAFAGLILIFGIFTGCDNYSKQYDTNTLIVNKNGSVVEVSVEDFNGSSVKADDLSAYVEDQVGAYNEKAGNKIEVKSIEAEDMSHVKLVLAYKDLKSYDEFNLLEYSLLDIGDVKESELTGSYTSTDDKKANPTDIIAAGQGKVLTVSEGTDIVIKGNLMYYNDEVTVKDGVLSTSGKKNAIIVFK